MKKFISLGTALICLISLSACQNADPDLGTFGKDIAFLKEHKSTIVLKANQGKSQIELVADYQGRVMTSTADGESGNSYGWLNYDLISSNKFESHINVFGGEDRFWLGPEGGQYSIFFEGEKEFTFNNWFTPAPLDTETFTLTEHDTTRAVFNKKMQLKNYSDFIFNLDVTRIISIFDNSAIEQELGIRLNNKIKTVGYQSQNIIKNIGSQAWHKDTGLLSIWILGMFNPSDNNTVIIPFQGELVLNNKYFGEVSSERLKVKNKAVLFRGDGKKRGKIGVPPQNALPVFGSYDASRQLLTVVKYSFNNDTDYVNSLWQLQDEPYAGDVINSYNDGPLENGDQLGPFYELESSSSAQALAPNSSMMHVHKTFHFEGDFNALNTISKQVLKINLADMPAW